MAKAKKQKQVTAEQPKSNAQSGGDEPKDKAKSDDVLRVELIRRNSCGLLQNPNADLSYTGRKWKWGAYTHPDTKQTVTGWAPVNMDSPERTVSVMPDVFITVDELVDDLNELNQTPEEIQLRKIEALLARLVNEKAPEDVKDAAAEHQGNKPGHMSKEARALAVKTEHPDWTDAQVAEAAGCHVKSLCRWKLFTTAKGILKSGRADLPLGRKPKDKPMEAWDADADTSDDDDNDDGES